MGDRIWKVHDHHKVGAIYNYTDQCEQTYHGFSYQRIGLYFLTKKAPQNFCDIHLMWGTERQSRFWTGAYYTAPHDSALGIDTTRSSVDRELYRRGGEPIYDPMGRVVMDAQNYSDSLNITDGGEIVYFGDPRPDAELREDAKTFQHGLEYYKDDIGKKRHLECWLLGPVSLSSGDDLVGSLVVKLEGRFEEGQGFQHCSLWESHYVDDGTLKGGWRKVDGDADATEKIRAAMSAMALPSFATGIVWKREQYKTKQTPCMAKASSG